MMLKVVNDMSYSRSWTQGFRCYELYIINIYDMNAHTHFKAGI